MGNCCVRVQLARNRMSQRGRRRRTIVLLLVGLDKAGKTTAAKGIVGEPTNETVPTIGFSTFSQPYKGYSVVIYDLGGGPQIRGIWNKYFIDVHGIIYVVDASDVSRIDESRLVLQQLLTHEKLAGKPLLVLANKQDCDGALDEIDVVEKLKLELIVNQQKCPTLVETCAALTSRGTSRKPFLDPGIQNGYRWLLSIIIKDFKNLDARVEIDTNLAKIQLEMEKSDRKRRVEEQRREREELEGTIIVPLKDNYFENTDGKIIQVRSSSVESEGNECTDEKTHHLSDSRDSGYTQQNGDDDDNDVVSLNSVQSPDSAVQSIVAKENANTSTLSSPSSNDLVQENNETWELPPKPTTFMRRSNKTGPAPTGILVLGSNGEQPIAKGRLRHKLPPLTPPANRVKMFEAKATTPVRLLQSLSLSSSEDSEERSIQTKTSSQSENVVSKGTSRDHRQLEGSTTLKTGPSTDVASIADVSNNILGEGRNNIFDVFTVQASSAK